MRVGVFGGSFNPPHIGHLIVAQAALASCGLDKVLWIPNSIPPHKDLEFDTDAEYRAEMVRAAIADNDAFEFSDVELTRDGKSFMVDTLASLTSARPSDDFWLIIGMDSLEGFSAWREPERILAMARLAVYPRTGYGINTVPGQYMSSVDTVEAPMIDVSSTFIRSRIRRGESVRYLVPDSVRDVIDRRGLYNQ